VKRRQSAAVLRASQAPWRETGSWRASPTHGPAGPRAAREPEGERGVGRIESFPGRARSSCPVQPGTAVAWGGTRKPVLWIADHLDPCPRAVRMHSGQRPASLQASVEGAAWASRGLSQPPARCLPGLARRQCPPARLPASPRADPDHQRNFLLNVPCVSSWDQPRPDCQNLLNSTYTVSIIHICPACCQRAIELGSTHGISRAGSPQPSDKHRGGRAETVPFLRAGWALRA
jgi:hypothetical protein